MVSLGLTDVFHDAYKFTQLIITVPVSSTLVKQSFSTLKRIKNYLRNSQGQYWLSSQALLGIEKEFLSDLRRDDTFNDNFIDIFAQKNRRIELVYKNTKKYIV